MSKKIFLDVADLENGTSTFSSNVGHRLPTDVAHMQEERRPQLRRVSPKILQVMFCLNTSRIP